MQVVADVIQRHQDHHCAAEQIDGLDPAAGRDTLPGPSIDPDGHGVLWNALEDHAARTSRGLGIILVVRSPRLAQCHPVAARVWRGGRRRVGSARSIDGVD